jgi:hypothetical protein
MGDPFDVIPYDVRPIFSAGQFTQVLALQDINGGWSKLGSGSFGNVYKGARRCYETPRIAPQILL